MLCPSCVQQHFLELQFRTVTRGRPGKWRSQRLELSTEQQDMAKRRVQLIRQRLQGLSHR